MKTLIAAAIVVSAVTLAPMSASAGERVNDAIMGGAAGALVAGPVGLVAGGLIGYTAGPNIASGIGLRDRNYPPRVYRDYPRDRYDQRRNTHDGW
jgi:hypothetical protein